MLCWLCSRLPVVFFFFEGFFLVAHSVATCLGRHVVLVLLLLGIIDRLLLRRVLWIVRGEELIRLLWLLIPGAIVSAVKTEVWRLLGELRLVLEVRLGLVVVLLLVGSNVRRLRSPSSVIVVISSSGVKLTIVAIICRKIW